MFNETLKIGVVSCAAYFPPGLVYQLCAGSLFVGIAIGYIAPRIGEWVADKLWKEPE